MESARPEDFAEVLVLLGQLWPGRELNRENLGRVYRANLSSDVQKYYVARNENGVIGFITMHIITNLWAQGCLLHIEELVVSESCRGQGVGRKLIEQALAVAAESNCRSVEVTSAFHRSRAHAFYATCGFEKKAFHFIRENRPLDKTGGKGAQKHAGDQPGNR